MSKLDPVARIENADRFAGSAHECRTGSQVRPAFLPAPARAGGLGGAR